MDYRRNFVKAMKAVAVMDQILASIDEVFQEYHQLVRQKAKGEIDQDYFEHRIQQLGNKRQLVFKKYDQVSKQVKEIKEEFGGEVKE